MPLTKRYDPISAEPALRDQWEEAGVYRFDRTSSATVYSVDTPPPTVSGFLHLGNVYSYSHTDFMARFWRMNGRNVFYPMGFDDNGLPTERLVERMEGITARSVGRQAFIERCLAVSEEMERAYRDLWQRLGLSVDWRYTYRTIDDLSRRTSQWSFVDLYRKGLAYHQKAPTIWCPSCGTAISQAEEHDLERTSEFVTLAFRRDDGSVVPIDTTRPELLPACVAVFVNPDDLRYHELVGKTLIEPFLGREIPVLADSAADPEKGTGVVMCCTFGDTTDVAWWYRYQLPLREAIGPDGRMTEIAGELAGLTVEEARREVIRILEERRLLLGRRPVEQTVRVHERCDTPVEYIVTRQWFIRVLDRKAEFIGAGERAAWHPPQMKNRYRDWVENMQWDWCISRQRYYGVPFPVWYCDECDEVLVADPDELPVDPTEQGPSKPCSCGGTVTAEEDVMDTWATSSMSPQIAGRWLEDEDLYRQVFPFSLRPQAYEIIRTWAFDTIVKSLYHFEAVPWETVAISGWGLAPQGAGKISKSRGGGPLTPGEMLDRHSADAVRYWAASTGPGKDSVISEEKIEAGAKLVTKLWNVARLAERFLDGYQPPDDSPFGTAADRWILSRLQRLIQSATHAFRQYDYAAAKSDVEAFFWRDLADNYLEMAKKRLYDGDDGFPAAQDTLYRVLLITLKLFAPILPYITDQIYQGLFVAVEGDGSIHSSSWPEVEEELVDETAETAGAALVEIARVVRRFKSDRSISLGAELAQLRVYVADPALLHALRGAEVDISSVTRAGTVEITDSPESDPERVALGSSLPRLSLAITEDSGGPTITAAVENIEQPFDRDRGG